MQRSYMGLLHVCPVENVAMNWHHNFVIIIYARYVVAIIKAGDLALFMMITISSTEISIFILMHRYLIFLASY